MIGKPIYNATDCIWIYGGISLAIIGIIGHVTSIGVILSSRSFRTTSSGVLIIALSLAGICALCTGLVRQIILNVSEFTIDIRAVSVAVCKIHTMLTYMSLQFIAWVQAIISVDRLVHVALPMWKPFKFLGTRLHWKHGLAIIIVELMVAAMLNIIPAVIVSTDVLGFCVKKDVELAKVWSYIDLFSFSLIPAATILLSNSIIVLTIVKHRTKLLSKVRQGRHSVTVMLFTTNVCFLVTTLPISVMLLLVDKLNRDDEIQEVEIYLIYTVCNVLLYAGTASTCFIYCVSGSKFRNQLKKLMSKLLHLRRSKLNRLSSVTQQ